MKLNGRGLAPPTLVQLDNLAKGRVIFARADPQCGKAGRCWEVIDPQVGEVDKAVYIQTMLVNVLEYRGNPCAAPALDVEGINDVALTVVVNLADACIADNNRHAFG